MPLSLEAMRRLLWKRRVAAARAWQDAARRDAAEHNAAVRRILEQAERPTDLVRKSA